ncbi:hypothetical protein R1sor_027587 [Riccia sorocarpa]|uniref:Uncharacterized protein n=1 Tax=Riccia sorocarpa TaxID=122646 RepID=A0ABD3GGR8_9MARC
MAKKLKSARRKSKDLRKELKNLPTGVVVSKLYYTEAGDDATVGNESLQVSGVSAMIAKKEEFKMQLEEHQSMRTRAWISGYKTRHNDRTRLIHSRQSPFTVPGNQFQGWSVLEEDGIPKTEWEKVWNYPNTDFWVWASSASIQDVEIHNKCLPWVEYPEPISSKHLFFLVRINESLQVPLRFGDGLFLEYFLHRLFCMPDMIKSMLRLVEVQLLRVWRTGQLNASALGHPEAYVEGVPMVEEIIRLWELSSIWICSHDSHGQTGNPSKVKPQKGKKIICEGPSNGDEIHRCVEFPPLPPEVATWFRNYAPTA